METPNPIYGVVCAGGGAHGAYQVGVLKYIHEHFCNGDASPFRVFCGTSAGSLNTAFFASRSYDARVACLELEKLWRAFHVPGYHGNILKNALLAMLKNRSTPRERRKPCWSLLDPQPLADVVDRGFKREGLDRSLAEGTTLGVAFSATELRSSRLVWFAEGPASSDWHSLVATSIETRLSTPHVVASCSVPFVFPPVRIGEHFYSDGGVANKGPFGPPINMGVTRILSVATDRPLPNDLPQMPQGFKPHFADVVHMLGDQLSHDYATTQAAWLEIVNYFREQLPVEQFEKVERIMTGREFTLSNYRPVEIKLFAPSRRISHTDIFDPEFFDQDLQGTSTVLRFHSEFVGKLIDFGHEDAAERHDELAEFFDPNRPQRRSMFSETQSFK